MKPHLPLTGADATSRLIADLQTQINDLRDSLNQLAAQINQLR